MQLKNTLDKYGREIELTNTVDKMCWQHFICGTEGDADDKESTFYGLIFINPAFPWLYFYNNI